MTNSARTSKLPTASEDRASIMVSKNEHGHYNVHGFSTSCKTITINDGKKDWFDTCLPLIKKKFVNTMGIRHFMQITEPCKVFAIVLEGYTSKGPHNYELHVTSSRFTRGYGKGSVEYIKPTSNTTAASMASFFKTNASTSATAVSSHCLFHFIHQTFCHDKHMKL